MEDVILHVDVECYLLGGFNCWFREFGELLLEEFLLWCYNGKGNVGCEDACLF